MTWIIENEAFAGGDILLPLLKELGKDIILWDDNFWNTKEYLHFPKNSIFHGSLGNASRLRKDLSLVPGSLCDEIGFSYSYIHENYGDYVLNKDVLFTTIAELIENPSLTEILDSEKLFARPNSPLKEFSGRIIPSENLTPAHFDYGFYHENINLPIVLAPLKQIEKEFRLVCVNHQILTGSEYLADGRKSGRTIIPEDSEDAFVFAQKIADERKQNDFAYIIDVCSSEGKLFLVEMNPFSGADLYHCDARKIIEAIEGGKSL